MKASITVPNEMGLEPTATLHSATTNSTAVASDESDQPQRPALHQAARTIGPDQPPRVEGWLELQVGEAHARRAAVNARRAVLSTHIDAL